MLVCRATVFYELRREVWRFIESARAQVNHSPFAGPAATLRTQVVKQQQQLGLTQPLYLYWELTSWEGTDLSSRNALWSTYFFRAWYFFPLLISPERIKMKKIIVFFYELVWGKLKMKEVSFRQHFSFFFLFFTNFVRALFSFWLLRIHFCFSTLTNY